MTNNFTPNKLPKFIAAICCGTSTKNGGTFGASEKDGGALKIDGAAHRKCRLAHRSSRPNFFSTETFHRNVEDAPNAHGVAMQNAYCCVWQQRAHVKKHAAHRTRADSAADCCTQNIVPSEKWQLGHCAA